MTRAPNNAPASLYLNLTVSLGHRSDPNTEQHSSLSVIVHFYRKNAFDEFGEHVLYIGSVVCTARGLSLSSERTNHAEYLIKIGRMGRQEPLLGLAVADTYYVVQCIKSYTVAV
jgi:hypothetical protein